MAGYKAYKSDADKVVVYERRLRAAEDFNAKWHKQVKSGWDRYESAHRSTAMTGSGHYISGATPMVIGNIDSQYSSLTSADIDLVVTPKGTATEEDAYVATAALNEEWKLTKTQYRGNPAIKDCLIGGIGFAKVGYEYAEELKEVPRTDETVHKDVLDLVAQAVGVDDGPSFEDILGNVPLTEQQQTILVDRVVVDYVPWDTVLWDTTAKQWSQLNWVAQKVMLPLDEVKENPLFVEYCARNKQSKKLQKMAADSHLDQTVTGVFADRSDDDERVTVYTIYDFETGTVCTWAKGSDFLLNEQPNAFSLNLDNEDKNPFVPIILRSTSSRVRGISEIEVLRDIATEKDLYHSRLGTILERVIPKIMAEGGTFTEAGRNAISGQEIGAIVETMPGKAPQDVKEFPVPHPLPEMFQMPQVLEQAGRDATGVSELQRGLFPDRKRTATETTEVVSASATRASEKRIALERFWTDIAKRILQLMQMFYEKDRVVRLADDEIDIPWTYSVADIAGTYGLEISLTPREAKSWQQRRDDALATLNVVGPLAQPGPDGSSPVNVTGLLRWVLLEMNIPRRVIRAILNLPEDQQVQAYNNIQGQAAQAQAQNGQLRPDMVPGPLSAQALAGAANQGSMPPELLAAAQGSSPIQPEAAEMAGETKGVVAPPQMHRPRTVPASKLNG